LVALEEERCEVVKRYFRGSVRSPEVTLGDGFGHFDTEFRGQVL